MPKFSKNKKMRNTLLIFFVVLLFSGVFTSCITSKKINYMQTPGGSIPAYRDTVLFEDYKLKPEDYLYIKVYSIDDNISEVLNGVSRNDRMNYISVDGVQSDLLTYKIKPNGCIDFPMVGEIYLMDKSIREANLEIENRLSSLLTSCSVETRIVRRYFSIISDSKSGRYSISKEKMNIFEALALAGDIGIYSDRSKVRIIREERNETTIKMFDLRSKDIIHSEYYYIEPNDVIYIQTLNEQFFSVTSFPSAVATVLTTYSFGALIYKTIVRLSNK